MRHRWKHSQLRTTSLAAAALASFLIIGAATPVRADDRNCQHRIVNADHRLDQAVARHGWQSRQADHARHELREARESCWNANHRWWDEHEHRWHKERDWDEHDHD